jgi:hypothetical protein
MTAHEVYRVILGLSLGTILLVVGVGGVAVGQSQPEEKPPKPQAETTDRSTSEQLLDEWKKVRKEIRGVKTQLKFDPYNVQFRKKLRDLAGELVQKTRLVSLLGPDDAALVAVAKAELEIESAGDELLEAENALNDSVGKSEQERRNNEERYRRVLDRVSRAQRELEKAKEGVREAKGTKAGAAQPVPPAHPSPSVPAAGVLGGQ